MRITHLRFFKLLVTQIDVFLQKLQRKFFGRFEIIEQYPFGDKKRCFEILFWTKVS